MFVTGYTLRSLVTNVTACIGYKYISVLNICFREVYEKVNLTWNANHTVTYNRIRRWYFDPENSKGNLSDRITTLNTVAVVSGDLRADDILLLNKESSEMKQLFGA